MGTHCCCLLRSRTSGSKDQPSWHRAWASRLVQAFSSILSINSPSMAAGRCLAKGCHVNVISVSPTWASPDTISLQFSVPRGPKSGARFRPQKLGRFSALYSFPLAEGNFRGQNLGRVLGTEESRNWARKFGLFGRPLLAAGLLRVPCS